jgi:hypothetical protein
MLAARAFDALQADSRLAEIGDELVLLKGVDWLGH